MLSAVGFCIIALIFGIKYFNKKDTNIYVLPTQSYKITNGSITNVTIPIATENSGLGDFKPITINSLNGEMAYVMNFEIVDEHLIKSRLKIYLVRMQIDLSQKAGEIAKFDKFKYSYNGLDKSAEIDLLCENENIQDFPLLIGSFQVREDKDDMIFDIINDTDKDIPIKNIDVGSLVKISERKVIDDRGNEQEVKGDLIVKAKGTIKQRIKFARNSDALCELSLRVTYGIDNKSKNLLGFALPGTADEVRIEKIIKDANNK